MATDTSVLSAFICVYLRAKQLPHAIPNYLILLFYKPFVCKDAHESAHFGHGRRWRS